MADPVLRSKDQRWILQDIIRIY